MHSVLLTQGRPGTKCRVDTACVLPQDKQIQDTEKREMQVGEEQKSRSAKWAQHKVVHTLHTSSLEEIPLSAGSSQLHTPACSSYNLIIIIIIIIIIVVVVVVMITKFAITF